MKSSEIDKEMDELRKRERDVDKSLLICKGEKNDINEIKLMNENGYYILNKYNLTWDILWVNNESDRLVVFFNGGRPVNKGPEFNRWSWYNIIKGSYLNIDDPMIRKYHEQGLELGWYYGTNDIDYCEYVVEIVREFARLYQSNKIVFYASSGGGNAAIRCASKITGAIAVVINAQLCAREYIGSEKFERLTGLSLLEDKFCRNDTMGCLSDASKYIFIENVKSKEDMMQLNHLIKHFGVKDLNDGINALSDNAIVWLYDAVALSKSAHVSQDWRAMYYAVERLVEIFEREDAFGVVKKNMDEYKIYTRLWNDRFNECAELKKKERNVLRLPDYININTQMRIVYEGDLKIEKKDNCYNHVVLYKNVKPRSIYKIIVRDDDPAISAYLLVKDEKYNRCLFVEKIKTGNWSLLIMSGEESDKIEIRVYPYEPGKCVQKSAYIKYLCLYEVEM